MLKVNYTLSLHENGLGYRLFVLENIENIAVPVMIDTKDDINNGSKKKGNITLDIYEKYRIISINSYCTLNIIISQLL